MPDRQPVHFLGSALDDLREFPGIARQAAGYQIDRLQRGLNPDDWRPMKTVGQGVREIRVQDSTGAYRVFYVATLPDGIYVLHCFHKTGEQTSQRDINLAARRYQTLVRENRQ